METDLILKTDLERLAEQYKVDREIEKESEINVKRRNHIASIIAEAYNLLKEIGKPHSDMSMRELELARAEIKKRCEAKIKKTEDELKALPFFRILTKYSLVEELRCLKLNLDNGYRYRRSYNVLLRKDYEWEVPTNFIQLVDQLFKEWHGKEIEEAKKAREAINVCSS